jgi:hypothetical protein
MQLPAIVTQKIGPLPGWGWGLLLVGGAVAFSAIRGRATKTEAPATDTGDPAIPPTYVFQNYDQDITYGSSTPPSVPPSGGRPGGWMHPRRPVPMPAPVEQKPPPPKNPGPVKPATPKVAPKTPPKKRVVQPKDVAPPRPAKIAPVAVRRHLPTDA